MYLKTKLVAAMVLAASASMAQATTYSVSANFADGGMQSQTLFNGQFDWDGTSVTNFSGMLSEAMWGWNSAIGRFDSNGTATGGMSSLGNGMMGTVSGVDYANKVYALPGGYVNNQAPLLNLTHQIASTVSGGQVTASVFLNDNGSGGADTNVFLAGGYVTGDDVPYMNGSTAHANSGNNSNLNAYFTLVFDAANPMNTALTTTEMIYGDCSSLGLMSNMIVGDLCMTGHQFGGSMGATPTSLAITEVAAVPLPGAVWMFGGALLSLFGANRRKSVLPA